MPATVPIETHKIYTDGVATVKAAVQILTASDQLDK